LLSQVLRSAPARTRVVQVPMPFGSICKLARQHDDHLDALRVRKLRSVSTAFCVFLLYVCVESIHDICPTMNSEKPRALPIADLLPRPITMQDYHSYAPEKLELIGGFLINGAANPEERRALLGLLLVNVGLLDAVRLAPEKLWGEALAQVYSKG